MAKAIIIMGYQSDTEWAEKISTSLLRFNIKSVKRIASAHKVPLKCYNLIREYENENVVFITIAGMSNALSGFTDTQTHCPVIACPPYSDKFGGGDVFSSLRMPSGVSAMVVLNPENAALATAKIIGLHNKEVRNMVKGFQNKKREELEIADNHIQENQNT